MISIGKVWGMRVFSGVLTESVTNQKSLEEKYLTEKKWGRGTPKFFWTFIGK